jgi:hypothetical protein
MHCSLDIRSLQPDREILVSARAGGFAPARQKLTLAEGENREAGGVEEPWSVRVRSQVQWLR